MNYSVEDVTLMHPAYSGLIGHGRFEVYKCLVHGEVKALKLLEHSGSKENIEAVKQSLRNEVVALTKANPSPFVVNLAGVVEYQYFSGILMEFLPRGNLSDFLLRYQPSFYLRVRALRDIASGIDYLHHVSVCEAVSHNDLKPLNIVVDADFTAKICDFEGSDVIARTSGVIRHKIRRAISCFTENYASPELLDIIARQGNKVERTRAMDVFSFSMIIYFMITGQHPFGSLESSLVMTKYMNSERPSILQYNFDLPQGMTTRLLSSVEALMERCWNQNPCNRPKIEEVASYFENWISQIDQRRLQEEINELKVRHPTIQEDFTKYWDTFDAFCDRRCGRTFQDESGACEVVREELPNVSCKATISNPVNFIEVATLINPKRGDRIIIKSPDKMIQCQIVQVDNLSSGN